MQSSDLHLDEELSELPFCHCSFLSESNRTAHVVNVKVSSKNLVTVRGEEQLVTYSSSPGKQRYYCRNCHSVTYCRNMPSFRHLKPGTIDECDQEFKTSQTSYFSRPSFSWLLDE